MKEKLKKNKIWIFLIGICIVLEITIVCILPNQAGPDEGMKITISKYIAENGKLPHGGDESIRDKTWGISYGFTPITPYILGGLFIKIVSFFSQDLHSYYIAGRLVSVLSYFIFCIFVVKISKKVFIDKFYKLIFVILVIMLPQMIFLATYINNDSFAMMCIAIIINYWISGLKSNWKISDCIKLSIGLGLCAISYYNAYGYILTSAILFIISLIISKVKFKDIVQKGLLIAVIAFVIAGWWFIRSAIIYNGDFLGLKTTDEYSNRYADDEYKASNRTTPHKEGHSLIYMLINQKWIKITLESFFAVFGGMEIAVDGYIYVLVYLMFLIGVFGFLLKLFNKENIEKYKEDKNKILLELIFVLNIIITVFLSVFYSYDSDFQPQGRYIMPLLIPIMYFITFGYENIIENILARKIKNKKIINLLKIIWVIFLFVIEFICFKTLFLFYK